LRGAEELTTEITGVVWQKLLWLEDSCFTKSSTVGSDYLYLNILKDQAEDPDKPLLFIHSTRSRWEKISKS